MRLGAQLAVVIHASDPVELGIGHESEGRLDPLGERADRIDAGAADHLRRHVCGRVKARRRDTVLAQLLGQIKREHDLRQLALTVGLDAAVAALEHDVVEIDRCLAGGAHVYDPRRRGAGEQGHEQPRQQVAGQVIQGEPQLVAVATLQALVPPVASSRP